MYRKLLASMVLCTTFLGTMTSVIAAEDFWCPAPRDIKVSSSPDRAPSWITDASPPGSADYIYDPDPSKRMGWGGDHPDRYTLVGKPEVIKQTTSNNFTIICHYSLPGSESGVMIFTAIKKDK